MSKDLTPKGKLVRKFGSNIFGNAKFDRLLERKPYPPGQQTKKFRRQKSEYSKMLFEKQKIRYTYGVTERQLRRVLEKARRAHGVVGATMLSLLERRLDNVIYRLGLAATRAQARQVVNHSHIQVNGRKVNIPSYEVKAGDEISVREQSRSNKLITGLLSENVGRDIPSWLSISKVELKGKVDHIPERHEIPAIANEVLVVEYYSK